MAWNQVPIQRRTSGQAVTGDRVANPAPAAWDQAVQGREEASGENKKEDGRLYRAGRQEATDAFPASQEQRNEVACTEFRALCH